MQSSLHTGISIPLLQITVSGKPLPKSTAKYYFALNKPKGYICTSQGSYQEGRRQRLVVDLFQEWMESEWRPRHTHKNAIPPRLFTVGRLDVPTTGLIFVTNDGTPPPPKQTHT